MTLGATIRNARELAGLSQAGLARRIGCDASTVARYESGIRTPSLDTLGRIARALGGRWIVDAWPPVKWEWTEASL